MRIPTFKAIQYSLTLSIGGNASFSSYEPVLPINWLAALNLGAGVEQPLIVVIRNRQAMQRSMPDGLDSEGQHGQRSVLLRRKSQAAEGAIIHLCRQDRKRPRRIWRRSSRNRALSRAIPKGWVPMSRCRQYVSVEILSVLQNTAKQTRDAKATIRRD